MRALALATSLSLGLSACARPSHLPHNPITPAPPRLVGNQDGDTIEVIPGVVDGIPVTVVSVVRAYEIGGKVGLCGALILGGEKKTFPLMDDFIGDTDSKLRVGIPENPGSFSIKPIFMRIYYRDENGKTFGTNSIDFSSTEGNCVTTSYPWSAELRTGHHLSLMKTPHVTTTYTSTPVYMPVFVPMKRRK